MARSAREIIDWNLPGESVWGRKRPLSPRTMERIMEGLRRCVGAPFVVPQLSGAAVRGVGEPLNTITSTGTGNALVEPFLMGIGGPRGRQTVRGVDAPLGAVLGVNHQYLVEPFLLPYNGERPGQALRVLGVDQPLGTATGDGRFGLVQPFLVSYYGNGASHNLSDALPTVTGRDRFALVEAVGAAMEQGAVLVADIRLRMLQPHELAAAHSFPADYQFVGGKSDAVKMVGNSWPVRTAQALCREILG